jgi:hypothetical protein
MASSCVDDTYGDFLGFLNREELVGLILKIFSKNILECYWTAGGG